jgi:hypothetical protein
MMSANEPIKEMEPGLSHPLRNCSIRLTNDGQVLIQAGEHAGIVIDEDTGIISIYGTAIRFLTEEVNVNGQVLSSLALEQRDIKSEFESGNMIRKILK